MEYSKIMFKFIHFIVAIFLATSFIYAQNASYKNSKQIEAAFQKSERESRFQTAAKEYTFIGEYLKAKEKAAAEYPQSAVAALTEQDVAYIKTFIPQDAGSFISKQAQTRQIVIINENHLDPRHRVFTASLLADLYKAGFRYFALEALNEPEDKLAARGFPAFESGAYTKEPQMGNLVREAMRIGFKIIPYESETHKNGEEREINQARNILKILEKDSKAKIFVHCGHDHIYKGDYEAWGKAMAGRIKEFSGIDPLTINQIVYTETATKETSPPVLKLANVNQPSVLVNKEGKIFTSLKDIKQWDISVLHPFAEYTNGRPNWLVSSPQRRWFKIPVNQNLAYPYLVAAYKENEPENATPVDIIEVSSANDVKALSLLKGNYKLVFIDADGKRRVKQIKVK